MRGAPLSIDDDEAGARGIGDWLSLAAAPTFAVMALLTGIRGEGSLDLLCAPTASPLGGMMPMYLLMCAVHLAPWLKLVTRRRDRDEGEAG